MSDLRVAVVGATGNVGRVMLAMLRDRGFPAREVVPFASERSAGTEIDGLVVQPLNDDSIAGFDLAIFSAGASVSREWAPRFVDAGAVVVDNSSAFRMRDDVPLVVSEVNPEALDGHRGLISNPNCSTMQLMVALKPIYDAAGIERLIISTYQSVSGTGKAAIAELVDQSHALLHDMDAPEHQVYPHRIAFNLIAAAGNFAPGDDVTDEEIKMVSETRKILGDDSIGISVTCVRVPVPNCHSESVNVQTRTPLSPEQARGLLDRAPGVLVIDDPATHSHPSPLLADGRDEVLVGRIRRDPSHECGLNLFVVADNLRKGAATNAIQIAELLLERRLLRRPAAAA